MDLSDLTRWPTGDEAARIRAIDPRWQLASCLLAVVGVLLLHLPLTVWLAVLLTMILSEALRIPRGWLASRLAIVIPVLALFVLPLPFLLPADDLGWQWGPVAVSSRGINAALVLAGKMLAVVLLVLTTLATAPLEALLKAAHAMHVPELLVQLALLTYRYLFVLAHELHRLRIALRVRGYRNRANLHSYRTVGHVAGTLLVRGHERAERVGQAMRCRGFDGRFRSLTEFRTRSFDVVMFVLIVGTAAGLVVVDRFLL